MSAGAVELMTTGILTEGVCIGEFGGERHLFPFWQTLDEPQSLQMLDQHRVKWKGVC